MDQIKRCSAPCVERISAPDYRDLVTQARRFLTGNSKEVQQQLAAKMEEAVGQLDFEAAAVYRDRIRALSQRQAHQDLNIAGVDNADDIAPEGEAGHICLQLVFFRAQRNYAHPASFLRPPSRIRHAEVLGP